MALKPGDLVFFSGRGWVSSVIQLATYSLPGVGFSHVGIIGRYHDLPVMYESTSFDRPPCAISGIEITGVQAHWLDDVAYEPGKGRLYVCPLKRDLYPHEEERLCRLLEMYRGNIRYDMIGAVRSGGFFLRQLLSLVHDESDATLFCSELVAAVLEETGIWSTPNWSKWNPNSLYRALRLKGIISDPILYHET